MANPILMKFHLEMVESQPSSDQKLGIVEVWDFDDIRIFVDLSLTNKNENEVLILSENVFSFRSRGNSFLRCF